MKLRPNEVNFLQDSRLKSSQQLFDGYILQLYVNEIELDNGQVVPRELVHHKPAVAVLAQTTDDRVILVKQYRPAACQSIWEIPAGILDKGDDETTLDCAKRELEEETGYQANEWQKLSTFYVSPGFLNEQITVYFAKELVKVDNPLPQDDDECIETAMFSRAEVTQMLEQGDIVDLKTLYALQYWLQQKG